MICFFISSGLTFFLEGFFHVFSRNFNENQLIFSYQQGSIILLLPPRGEKEIKNQKSGKRIKNL